MPLKKRGIATASMAGMPASTGCPAMTRALLSAVRISRPSGLSPASGSSVRSSTIALRLPASACAMAGSGNGRITLT